ncbi:MAG TPA: hypothetical protein VFI76_06335 [Terrimicrobiaceae bacterium]|nr:hypothetical protein [Terrimicrobiaceae bacterium]
MTTIETLKAELAIANERATKAEARAQVLFKEADFFMRACDAQKARAEAAEKERDAALFDKAVAGGKVRVAEVRAEAAEKALAEERRKLTTYGY